MTQCRGGLCPQKQNCAHHDAFLAPTMTDTLKFEPPPFNTGTGECDYFLSNGNQPATD